MGKSPDELKTFHQLLDYAENCFHESGRDGKLYWQGVKDGIRRAGVLLDIMSEESCVQIRDSSKYRPLINEIVGKNKI